MTQPKTSTAGQAGAIPDPRYAERSPMAQSAPQPTGWTGWIAFGAVMMVMLGSFHAIAGFVGIFQESYFLVGSSDLVVEVDYTTWGWVHLIAGIVIIAAGAMLITGATWARVVTVAVAFLSALLNLAFLAAYPIWSTIMITVDILVIWAVIVHGSEVREPDYDY